MIERSDEATAFLDTIDRTDPRVVSACDGWTTHEVAAHVAAIAIEVNRHLEPYQQGDPVPATRSFEEREAPLRAMPSDELRAQLDVQEERMRLIVSEVLARDADAVIPWTGRHMAVAKFIPHLRNEHALHRWDIAGDDDVSSRLLGSVDLVEHSVGELGRILLAAGHDRDPAAGTDFTVRLRSAGHQDLRVTVTDGTADLNWADDDSDIPAVELDAAARHLLIWGRRPDDRGRLRSQLPPPDLARLQRLLSGY